jgi:hypothetical protein
MADKKFLSKNMALERIEDLKSLVAQAEAIGKKNDQLRATIKRLVAQIVTDQDVGRTVRYIFGTGDSETILEGKLIRAPSEGKSSFAVEFKTSDGSVKKLPRHPSMFVEFVS